MNSNFRFLVESTESYTAPIGSLIIRCLINLDCEQSIRNVYLKIYSLSRNRLIDKIRLRYRTVWFIISAKTFIFVMQF